MQVEIGGARASVSDDGRDIQFAPPAGGGRALGLPSSDMSHSPQPPLVASSLASPAAAEAHVLAADLYERAGAGIILCVLLLAIAYKRFVDRKGAGSAAPRSRLSEELDDAAFLKRYGRGAQ